MSRLIMRSEVCLAFWPGGPECALAPLRSLTPHRGGKVVREVCFLFGQRPHGTTLCTSLVRSGALFLYTMPWALGGKKFCPWKQSILKSRRSSKRAVSIISTLLKSRTEDRNCQGRAAVCRQGLVQFFNCFSSWQEELWAMSAFFKAWLESEQGHIAWSRRIVPVCLRFHANLLQEASVWCSARRKSRVMSSAQPIPEEKGYSDIYS